MNPRSLPKSSAAFFVLAMAALGDLPAAEVLDGVYPVLLSKLPGGVARIHMPELIYGFDILRGDIRSLRESEGNFVAATRSCEGEDVVALSFDDADVPDTGEGFWYLVRLDQNSGFPEYGAQSYNGGLTQRAHQVASREPGIAASMLDCGCYYFCCREHPGQCFFGIWP